MKKIFLILFLLSTGIVLAQDKSENEVVVKSFAIETSSIEEFKNYDWKSVEKMFSDNKNDDLINISIAFKPNKSAAKPKISYGMKGKKSELPVMIEKLEKLVRNYKE